MARDPNTNLKTTPSSGTDTAALAAGIVAAAVAPWDDPGPWTLANLPVAVAYLAIMIGYVWEHRRNLPQSWAVASVIAFSIVPVIGVLVDLNTPRVKGAVSRLTIEAVVFIWVVATATVCWLDRLRQPPADWRGPNDKTKGVSVV